MQGLPQYHPTDITSRKQGHETPTLADAHESDRYADLRIFLLLYGSIESTRLFSTCIISSSLMFLLNTIFRVPPLGY